jgi:WD40 repeat protein
MTLGGEFENPFPGLRPFEAHQAELFFGRDEQVEEVLNRLEKMRFLALVGTSGCGKSSLVRAGLLPALRRGYFGGSSWTVAVLRPGGDPIGKLATELSEAFQVSQSEVLSTLRRSSLGLTDFVRQHCRSGQSLLIVIDQFEELIRYRQEAGKDHREESAAFVKLFLAATGNSELPAPDLGNVPIHVVLTMRSDFLGKCSLFRGLPEALNNSQYLVPRMTREQQREAIEGPVGMAGARITPQLVQRLLNDVGDSPDQLPVLQHALMKTWEQSREAREQGQSLDLPHYESVGRMDRALNLDADRTFGELGGDAEREAIARRMFQALVGPGSEDDQTRRPMPLSEIVAITAAEESKVRQVVDVFRHNGFLTLSADADPIVDITHESLIRLWDRLKGWVKEEAESAKIYVRLADSADRGMALYRGPELTQALRWSVGESPNAAWALRYSAHDLSRAMDFLERSRRARSRDLWIRRGVVVALAAGLAVISILYFKAERQRKEALWQNYEANVRAADVSLGRTDVKAAKEQLLQCDPSLRAWEWRYLWRRADSSIATLYAHSHIPASGYEKLATALSSDGNRIYWNSGDTLHVWDASTHQQIASYGGFGKVLASNKDGTRMLVKKSGVLSVRDAVSDTIIATLVLPPEDVQSVETAAFDADNKRIAIGCRIRPSSGGGKPTAISSKNGTLAVWDIASARVVRKLDGESSIGAVAFSPDGRSVAAGLGCGLCTAARGDMSMRVWDVASGKPRLTMETPGSWVSDVAFNPEGSRIAGTVGKDVRIWDADTGKLINYLSGHSDSISAATFSPDGTLFATAADDHTVRIWNTEHGSMSRSATSLATLLGHSKSLLTSVAFSSDSANLLVASQSGEVRIWNAATLGGCLIPNRGVNSIAVSPDGGSVVSVNFFENVIRLWDSVSGKKLRAWEQNDLYHGSQAQGSPLAFSPNGLQIASGSSKGVRLWDAKSGAALSNLQGHTAAVIALAFAPTGAYLASGSQDKTVRLWELSSGRAVHSVSLPDPVDAVAFDPGGKQLLIGMGDLFRGTLNRGDSTAALWSPFRDTSPRSLSDPPKFLYKGAYSVALSPDGSGAAVASTGGVLVWRTSSGERPLELRATLGMTSIAFNPDGSRLLLGSIDRPVQVWDARRYEHLLDLADVTNEFVLGLVFSPDGSRALSYFPFTGIRIWETKSEYYPGAEQLVNSLREELGFSADVIRRLQTDRKLDPNLRQAALKLAKEVGDNENILQSKAWKVVRARGNRPEEYRLALRQAEAAARADPSNWIFLRTKGAAQYRNGAFRDALDSLQRSVELSESPRPTNRVLMAMTLFRLGQADKAQDELKKWRNEKVRDAYESFELEGLVREADALMSPPGRPAVPR